MAECTQKIGKKDISDITDGLAYFGKFGRSLICAAAIGDASKIVDFVDLLKTPTPENIDGSYTI